MFFCLQLIVGIRDQSTLLLSWVLMVCVMLCGWATELWSRPAKREADGYRGWVGDPLRTDHIMLLERKKRAHRNRNYELRPERPVVYQYEQTINVLSSRERNQYREQDVPPMPPPLTYMERRELRDYARAYTVNYLYRMIPHFVGWLPYVACWFVYGNTFLQSLDDVRQENEDLYDRIPAFVPYAIGGTALWFTSFTFVQFRYQYVRGSPKPLRRKLQLTQPCACSDFTGLLLEGKLTPQTLRPYLVSHPDVRADRADLLRAVPGLQADPRTSSLHEREYRSTITLYPHSCSSLG